MKILLSFGFIFYFFLSTPISAFSPGQYDNEFKELIEEIIQYDQIVEHIYKVSDFFQGYSLNEIITFLWGEELSQRYLELASQLQETILDSSVLKEMDLKVIAAVFVGVLLVQNSARILQSKRINFFVSVISYLALTNLELNEGKFTIQTILVYSTLSFSYQVVTQCLPCTIL